MNRVYVSITLDTSTSLYVGELLGFSGCHSQGTSLKDMLENLAQAIELVDIHPAEVLSLYFDMDYPDPAAMARKSILVSTLLATLQDQKLDVDAAADVLGVEHQVLKQVLRGRFRDTPETTLRAWVVKATPNRLLYVTEVEQEDDGRWWAEVLSLTALAYGETSFGAVAAAVRTSAVSIADRMLALRRISWPGSNAIADLSLGQDGQYSRVHLGNSPQENDLVELVAASPAGRPIGTVGVVVDVYPNAEAFEVEFNTGTGYSVETIYSPMCRPVLLVNPLLKRWASAVAQRLGRPEESIVQNGLLANDFPSTGVRIMFEDGSDLRFERAFYLSDVAHRNVDQAISRVAVFTEHVGHHEFWIGPQDQVEVVEPAQLASRNKRQDDFGPNRNSGGVSKTSVSHEVASIQEFRENPQEARAYLRSVLEEGSHSEFLRALRRVNAALGE